MVRRKVARLERRIRELEEEAARKTEASAQAIRESEKRFLLFMDNMPGLAWIKDIKGRYVYANEPVLKEVPPFRGEWLGKTDAELWPPEVAKEYCSNDKLVLSSCRPLQTVEHFIKDGEMRHVLAHKFPMIDESGSVVMIGGMSVDLTERIKAEESLRVRVRQQDAILQFSRQALAGGDTSSLLHEAAAVVTKTLRVDYCNIMELTHDGTGLILRTSTGWDPALVNQIALPSGAQSAGGYAVLHNEAVAFEDIGSETRFSATAIYRRYGIFSGGVVPIPLVDRPFGVISALTTVRRVFSEEDMRFLQSLGNILAAALQRRFLEGIVIEIAEREQRRIGQELHDGVCQNLVSIGLFAKSFQTRLARSSIHQSRKARELVGLVCDAASQVREIARGLIPADLDGQNLIAALRALAGSIEKRTGISCRFRRVGQVVIPENVTAYHLFRIAQEAVNNAVKHSHGKHIWIVMRTDDNRIALSVRDDGIGLPAEPERSKGVGLQTMAYRASLINASLWSGSVRTAGSKGANVVCSLPREARRSSNSKSAAAS
ncbi:MAG TPA: PAS domain-containing protein [Terriglobia bacterium]|jgi:PAS domain S-box-containing protein